MKFRKGQLVRFINRCDLLIVLRGERSEWNDKCWYEVAYVSNKRKMKYWEESLSAINWTTQAQEKNNGTNV